MRAIQRLSGRAGGARSPERRAMGLLWIAVLMLVVSTNPAIGRSSTYDEVVAGMECQQNSMGSLECDYRVGDSLHVNIAGVGDSDAAITFLASSFEGDYYGSVGVLHGCVIVKPGEKSEVIFDYAFVSPRTGKVYRDWESCQEGH